MSRLLANFIYVAISVFIIYTFVPTAGLSYPMKLLAHAAVFVVVYYTLRTIAPRMFSA